eukprot:scaffold100971_cov31-Prasinocladus_malaysianus.AAC.1
MERTWCRHLDLVIATPLWKKNAVIGVETNILIHCLCPRAAARLMLGQPVLAVADCEAAIVTDPGFSRARLRLATCRIRMDKSDRRGRSACDQPSNHHRGQRHPYLRP